MAKIHRAYTRMTAWLQYRGHLLDMTAPAKKRHIVETFRVHYAHEFGLARREEVGGGRRGHDEILLRLCELLGIEVGERRTPEMHREENALTAMRRAKQPLEIRADPRKVQRLAEQYTRAATDEFLSTYEWRRVRMQALTKYGARCQCCGATPGDGTKMNVDHIKPRKIFPELALDLSNLQVLCDACNHGKGNWDMTDWRKEGTKV